MWYKKPNIDCESIKLFHTSTDQNYSVICWSYKSQRNVRNLSFEIPTLVGSRFKSLYENAVHYSDVQAVRILIPLSRAVVERISPASVFTAYFVLADVEFDIVSSFLWTIESETWLIWGKHKLPYPNSDIVYVPRCGKQLITNEEKEHNILEKVLRNKKNTLFIMKH